MFNDHKKKGVIDHPPIPVSIVVGECPTPSPLAEGKRVLSDCTILDAPYSKKDSFIFIKFF